jgi:erythromycin esterase-like protein
MVRSGTIFLFILLFSCGKRPIPPSRTSAATVQFAYYPLHEENDLDILLKEIGDTKLVLLGESSHGSSEFYQWRAAISKRLITEKGFDFIAVEGDWYDMLALNDLIAGKRYVSVYQVMHGFNRWPRWLWANQEFAGFTQWLQQNQTPENSIGIYGLDVFAFSKGVNGLKAVFADTSALHAASECFNKYGNDAMVYSTAVTKARQDCRQFAEAIWQQALKITGGKTRNEQDLMTLQAAALIKNGEAYFRTRNQDQAASWNGRVDHMHQTIKRLLEYYGRNAKGIIWAHNTHVGDAHYTDMTTRRRTNIGERLRGELGGNNVFIIGFGCYNGEVIAGESWGAEPKKIRIYPAKQGSWEELLHKDAPVNKILLSRELVNNPALKSWVPQRAIGVVYGETYIPSIIHRRYDAFLYIDSTTAIKELR